MVIDFITNLTKQYDEMVDLETKSYLILNNMKK